jgi:hypothetical protein
MRETLPAAVPSMWISASEEKSQRKELINKPAFNKLKVVLEYTGTYQSALPPPFPARSKKVMRMSER